MPLMVRPILRIATFWALYQVLLTVPFAPLAKQTAGAIPESVTKLQSQLEAILKTAKEGDPKQFDDLISGLQVPENPNWDQETHPRICEGVFGLITRSQ